MLCVSHFIYFFFYVDFTKKFLMGQEEKTQNFLFTIASFFHIDIISIHLCFFSSSPTCMIECNGMKYHSNLSWFLLPLWDFLPFPMHKNKSARWCHSISSQCFDKHKRIVQNCCTKIIENELSSHLFFIFNHHISFVVFFCPSSSSSSSHNFILQKFFLIASQTSCNNGNYLKLLY